MTTKVAQEVHVPIWRRVGLTQEEAAAYLGVKPREFENLLENGLMPPPRIVDTFLLWSRVELEQAFSRLPIGPTDPQNHKWSYPRLGM